MVHGALRSNFALAYGFAIRNGMNVHVAYIPDQFPYGETLDFRYVHVRALFDYAEKCAASGELWNVPGDVAAPESRADLSASSDQPSCPAVAPVLRAPRDAGSEVVQTADATP